MKTTFIYILIDPETNMVRYVGKSNNPNKRLYQHIIRSKNSKGHSHKINWIKSLDVKGLKPIISIIDEVKYEDWEISESYWIAQFKQWGFKLTNLTEGGQGGNGYKHSKESIKRISESQIGKKLSEEHKKSISESVKKHAKENPNYNRGGGNTKHIIDRDEIYEKYIIDNLSLNKCAEYFGVGKKKIFDTLQEYNIKKDKSAWKHQLSSHPKKTVLQYDLEGNFIKNWNGLMEIQKELGFNKSNIANCCRGLCKTANEFIWRYEDEFIEVKTINKQKYNLEISQYDLNYNLISKFKSINKASNETGISRKIVKRCCEKRNSFDSFYFRYD